MITYNQQLTIINDIFSSFLAGKRIKDAYIVNKGNLNIYFNHLNFESLTVVDFKFNILYIMINKYPKSLIELLMMLSKITKEDKTNVKKLKQTVITAKYELKADIDTLSILDLETISPYIAYKNKKIGIFGLNYYYNKNPDKITGRVMKKEIKTVDILMQHFNIKL